MKRNWEIYPWHGKMPERAAQIAQLDEETGIYWFEGTVDEFINMYEGNVLVLTDGPTIGVSDKNHFKQC